MKKILGLVFIFCITLGFASCGKKDNIYDKVSVSMVQSVAVPGGTYAPLENATLPAEKLQNGVINLRYDFTVNAEKDNKRSMIAMHIDFPAGIKAERLTYNGIYHEDQQKNEYYISQHKDGTGGIEFEVKIPNKLYDRKLPIDISFKYYEVKSAYMEYVKRGAIIGGVVGFIFGGIGAIPGALVGAGIGAGIAYFSDPYKSGGPSFNDILSVRPEDMRESKKHFMISVIN